MYYYIIFLLSKIKEKNCTKYDKDYVTLYHLEYTIRPRSLDPLIQEVTI